MTDDHKTQSSSEKDIRNEQSTSQPTLEQSVSEEKVSEQPFNHENNHRLNAFFNKDGVSTLRKISLRPHARDPMNNVDPSAFLKNDVEGVSNEQDKKSLAGQETNSMQSDSVNNKEDSTGGQPTSEQSTSDQDHSHLRRLEAAIDKEGGSTLRKIPIRPHARDPTKNVDPSAFLNNGGGLQQFGGHRPSSK
ncbi:Rho GTPase-activating protein 20 [Cyberlindnera fabianii]|uniref:Rho GTPase-activating protein 20 n=1 Tax=Cyberlindnera fabianii TaxID=36022 RepID=A0A1V2LBC0_CYBFA|nr:Rho GTPase-activating protein 20 [Cyberlindnera fabianii]